MQAFDHAAALVNALFSLGIRERQVTARNPEFLKALGGKLSGIQSVFEKAAHVEFIRRVAALRHAAAHPRVGYTRKGRAESFDHPPTNEELDEDIREAGLDYLLSSLQPGPVRDGIREMLRSNARAARYEEETSILWRLIDELAADNCRHNLPRKLPAVEWRVVRERV